MAEDDKPWWNDQDAVGGAFATIVLFTAAISLATIIIGVAVRVALWIING